MTFLASYPSALGRISLHRLKDGSFETRRTYRHLLACEDRVCHIPVSPERAEEFHAMCAERGSVRRKFPVEVGA